LYTTIFQFFVFVATGIPVPFSRNVQIFVKAKKDFIRLIYIMLKLQQRINIDIPRYRLMWSGGWLLLVRGAAIMARKPASSRRMSHWNQRKVCPTWYSERWRSQRVASQSLVKWRGTRRIDRARTVPNRLRTSINWDTDTPK
jgi:hypothetical protein